MTDRRAAIELRPLARAELSSLEAAWPSHGVHEAHLRRQQLGEATYLVAWQGVEPLGSAMAFWAGPLAEVTRAAYPDVVEIAHLQVRGEHRGKGVGTALVRAAEEHARDRGHGAVGLGVGLDNPDAVRLYERLGYVSTGVVSTTTYSYRDTEGKIGRAHV